MSEMTVRERMLSVYNGKLPDKTALGIYQRYLPRGYEEVKVRDAGVGLILYHPTVTMLAPPWHFYEGFISEVKNTEITIKHRWENGKRIERRIYSTPVGELWQESELDAGGVGSEHIIKHYITDIEDYKIMSYIAENTVFRPNSGYISSAMEDLGQGGVMLGRLDRSPYQKCLIELAGPEQFLMDMYTDKEEVEALLEVMSEKLAEATELSLETPADLYWQPDNVTVEMTPPSAFEKYCLPFYKKQTELVKQTGKPYFLHIDGKFKMLADMVRESGASGVESISVPEMGGDLYWKEAKALLPEMVLIPNFPSNLALSDEKAIFKFVEKLQNDAKGSPLMLQVSEDIPPHSWKKVLPALIKAIK